MRRDGPYEAARAAVAAWSTTERAQLVAGNAAGGAAAYLPSDPGVGVYDATLGALVATYPATGYARWLYYVATKCTHIGVVELFAGTISELGRITSYGDGSLSEYDPNHPRLIPEGAALYIVWYVPDATHSATAKAGLREVS